ncbi:helix-turn-helix transcriptional regulator [Parafrigoribacterium soli]|uniref:helix-turn-helix transcriptional regulator n=1 Tax=Parafrigoribacterium soli TaxID=3144663 RepID=UPI0032EFCBB5
MGSRRPPDLRTLASLSRVKLLYALLQHGSLTVEELAAEADLHTNTAREHLHRLIEDGFAVSRPLRNTSRGRPKVVYALAENRNDPVQAAKINAALQRVEQLNRLFPGAEGAEERTAADRQVDMVEDHMDQCGFDTTVDKKNLCVHIYECPVEALAREHPEVCQVHFHLVGTALRRVDGPLETAKLNRLDPDDGCSVDLRRNDEEGIPVRI